MTRIRQITTNFTAGELSPDLLARGDTAAYTNGANRLRNVTIQPTGGVTRRAGLKYLASLSSAARIIPFEFTTQSGGLLAIMNGTINIYVNGILAGWLSSPWTTAQLSQITWAQSADTLLLMHPDVPPKKFQRTSPTTYSITDWAWATDNNVVLQPYYKFADSTVTLTPSATTGNITVTASTSVFWAALTGARYRIGGREILVTAVNSPTNISATVIQTLGSVAPTTNWQEPAFSAVRGYPTVACFHQDRLVIGGGRDVPNRIWMSQTGDIWNFYKSTGYDTDGIEFGIVSDQANAIRGLFSGRHLQVFTNGAEYMVSGDPMTPSNVQIRRQTRIGSMATRYIPPQAVEGVVLFMARNGQELREFAYSDVEQAYAASDVALLAKHMIQSPIDQVYDAKRRQFLVARADGKIAALTLYRTEDIKAWTLFETDGTITSLAVTGDETYAVVLRGTAYSLERFDDSIRSDAAITQTYGTPTATITGLSHLNGKSVSIIADGVMRTSQTVTGGQVTLSPAATTIEIGIPYRHIVEPLPPALTGAMGDAKNIRMIEAIFRVRNTSSLRLDVGRGLRNVFLTVGASAILPATSPLESGDIAVSAFGWYSDMTKPLWVIDQDHALPFTLLGVKTEIKRNE